MKYIIKKKSINTILMIGFIVFSVILPGDLFNIKKILFLVICIFNFRLLLNSFFKKENGFYVFFGLIFPVLLILYSALWTSEIYNSFARSFAAFIFLLIFVIDYYDINYEKILIKSINLILLVTLFLVLADVFQVIDVNQSGLLRDTMYDYDLGIMGKSENYPFYYKVFLKSSPLLVLLLFNKFYQKKKIGVLLTSIALILSGTRANVIFPFLLLPIYYFFFANQKSKKTKFFLATLLTTLFIIFSPNIIASLNEIFIIKGEVSNAIRAGHVEGIKELINNNPLILILGSGMGSYFFSFGSNELTNTIEWSYLDLWRQMGFLFFSLFILFIIKPLFSTVATHKKFAYSAYLCIAATNPLLFSSTGYLVYLYIYSSMGPRKED